MSFLRLQYHHRKIATVAANNHGETEADYFGPDAVGPFDGPYGAAVYANFDRTDCDLGPNWTRTYSGSGAGALGLDGATALWVTAGMDLSERLNQ